MRELKLLLSDRRRRQRGSILSGILIIVAVLAVLIGGLLTELTGSFTLSRDLVTRVNTQATVTSAAELAIHQLQSGPVPALCTQDYSGGSKPNTGPWSLTLNGHAATVTQTCSAIVPEQASSLGPGSYNVDGIHDTARNRYLVADAAGRLLSYPFGQIGATWSTFLGGGATAALVVAADPNGSVDILVPVAKSGAGCAGHCVVVFNGRGGNRPAFSCDLAAGATVSASPGVEVTAGGAANFPGYAFFGDSDRLYVYDASSGGGCDQLTSTPLNGRVAGAPLVFPGVRSGNSVSDEIFVLVTGSGGTSLQHWRYTETNNDGGDGGDQNGNKSSDLSQIAPSLDLAGANAIGYGASSNVPSTNAPLSLAVAASGRLDVARIAVNKSGTYSMSKGPSTALLNGSVASRAPYWCHCPGQDLIGVGSTNGFLYVFNSGLTLTAMYNGGPDGILAINTTPMADANGEWYFGASDGSVYDVEMPVTGLQLFKAAKFGPGNATCPPSQPQCDAITSSPVVGTCPGGLVGPCMYFASTGAGAYFVRIGSTRVSDLRACVTSSPGVLGCVMNPQLWARVQVGPPGGQVGGATGVFVQGWSYYSP